MTTKNQFSIEGDVCKIHIASQYGDFTALVDAEDYPRIKMFRWKVSKTKSGKFRVRATMGWSANGSSHDISLHQLITSFQWTLVDHANRDMLDNRKANLRPGTYSQNRANSSLPRGKRLPGVTQYSPKTFVAIIRVNKQFRTLGKFATEQEAHDCYVQEHIKIFQQHSVYWKERT